MKRLLTFPLVVLCVFLYVCCSKESSPAQGHVELGTISYEAGEYDKAVAKFEKAIGIDPNHAGAYEGLGEAYHFGWQDKYDLAIESFQKALAIAPAHRKLGNIYQTQGTTYKAQGKYDLAIESYQKAIVLDPNHPNAYYGLGITCHKQGKYDLAIEFYQKAISIDPEGVMKHYDLARVYSLHGKKTLSIKSLRKAISLDKDFIISVNPQSFRPLFAQLSRCALKPSLYSKARDCPRTTGRQNYGGFSSSLGDEKI